MVIGRRETVCREIDRAFQHGTVAGLSEGQLLRQFVVRRDEVAFEALVSRHGPMVLGVCRRVLDDPHDAADAFQATFLVLVRKAGSLRDAEQLGPWLHGVARKVARRARSDSARRRDRERRGARPEVSEDVPASDRAELRGILDEELGRLPDRYRRPMILCYLEGQTHEEAARRLRCTTGTLRGRLDRGREKLRSRLGRRGLAPSAAFGATAIAAEVVTASVPHALLGATVFAASRALAGRLAPAAVSASALTLADGVLRSAILARLRLAASLLALGTVFLVALPRALTVEERATSAPATPNHAVRDEPLRKPADGAVPVDARDGITVEGRVLDAEGLPIVGARVGQGSDRQQGATPEAITDARGRFTFHDVAPGPLILTAQAAGHGPDLKSVVAGPAVGPIEFRLGPGRSIGGRITDLEGKPIAGAPVSAGPWRSHNSLVWQTMTDADGRYRWDDAPGDEVLIDIGSLGYTSKRFVSFAPLQADRDVAMPRPQFVHGRVTDEATGEPIGRFTVLTGYGDAAGERIDWEYARALEGLGGIYEVKLGAEYRGFTRYIRIEADGYFPQRSGAFEEAEAGRDHAFDFKLRRGAGMIAGSVRQPDGSPLAGADVVLLTSLAPITNGRFSSSGPGRVARTGPDGRFRFPSMDTTFTVVVLHESGSAERASAQLAASPALTIEPWGRIEGTYLVGPRPGAGEELSLARGRSDRPSALTQYNGHATVDEAGHFAFERVRPGEVAVAQMVRMGPFSSAYPRSDPVKVEPGQTASLKIGGTGRPLVGRLEIPAPLAGQVDWTWSQILLISGRRPSRVYIGRPTPGGAFRIEDVPAGSFELLIQLKKAPSDPNNGFDAHEIATARRRIQVAEIPGGRSDEPLDVGAIAPVPVER